MSIEQYKHMNKPQRRSKYGAKKTLYDGVKYDSQAEAQRAQEIDMLIKAGKVQSVERQPKFDIYINDTKVCYYKADFRITWADGTETIEDVKGFKTAMYRLKKKMTEAAYGIKIVEVYY